MNTTLLFVLIAFVLLVSFSYLAIRRTKELPDVDGAVTAIQSLDIEAFRNLMDPEEEAFLRANLPPPEFKRIKRKRAQAALAYVKAVSDASLQFARFGDAAQRSSDPDIAASGRLIANSATYLRLRALDASVRLIWSEAFPGFSARLSGSLLEQYDHAANLLQKHQGLKRARSQAA